MTGQSILVTVRDVVRDRELQLPRTLPSDTLRQIWHDLHVFHGYDEQHGKDHLLLTWEGICWRGSDTSLQDLLPPKCDRVQGCFAAVPVYLSMYPERSLLVRVIDTQGELMRLTFVSMNGEQASVRDWLTRNRDRDSSTLSLGSTLASLWQPNIPRLPRLSARDRVWLQCSDELDRAHPSSLSSALPLSAQDAEPMMRRLQQAVSQRAVLPMITIEKNVKRTRQRVFRHLVFFVFLCISCAWLWVLLWPGVWLPYL